MHRRKFITSLLALPVVAKLFPKVAAEEKPVPTFGQFIRAYEDARNGFVGVAVGNVSPRNYGFVMIQGEYDRNKAYYDTFAGRDGERFQLMRAGEKGLTKGQIVTWKDLGW